MKKRYLFKTIFIFVFFILIFFILNKPNNTLYKINIIEEPNSNVFIEDFNSPLDTNYWNIIEQGNNPNNSLQYFTPKNITVQDGFLSINALKEKYKDHNYTSGMITTKNKFEFLYGRIIIKAKPAIGDGLLSAIWLLPSENNKYIEVDMIEVLGSDYNTLWTGTHYYDLKKRNKYFKTYNNYNDFFTYELEWNEKEIKCYINNNLYYTTRVGIPHEKMYLILNLDVGGNWPGKPNNNIFPASFLIDYIAIIPREDNK